MIEIAIRIGLAQKKELSKRDSYQYLVVNRLTKSDSIKALKLIEPFGASRLRTTLLFQKSLLPPISPQLCFAEVGINAQNPIISTENELVLFLECGRVRKVSREVLVYFAFMPDKSVVDFPEFEIC